MINIDAVKGIKPTSYFHTEKWDRNLKVGKKETKDDGSQSDAKNRQQSSYQEILYNLLDTLKDENCKNINIDM